VPIGALAAHKKPMKPDDLRRVIGYIGYIGEKQVKPKIRKLGQRSR
jgi:hypothetical protein